MATRPDRGTDKTIHPNSRSPFWEATEAAFRQMKEHATCAVCGGTDSLQVHHVQPFHYCVNAGRPDLELDRRNLITLCESKTAGDHHEIIGHLGDFKIYNPQIREHVEKFKGSRADLKGNEAIAKAARPDPWHVIAADARKLKVFLDQLPPPLPWEGLSDQAKWQLIAYEVVPAEPVTQVPDAMKDACARFAWSGKSPWYGGKFYKDHGPQSAFFQKNKPVKTA